MCDGSSGHELVSRREVIGGVAAAALAARSVRLGAQGSSGRPNDRPDLDRPYMNAALGAERWLRRQVIRGERGATWAADPNDPGSIQHNLYSGSAGVLLFYAELARVTADRAALDLTREGATYLANAVVASTALEDFKGENAGLYTGLAGVAYALERAYRVTGEPGLGQAARAAISHLGKLAEPAGAGAAWNESNDIISGSAGIGLFLLWAAEALGSETAVALATRAGRQLLGTGVASQGGLTWGISARVPRRYPNFSHGAGGVSYFLASLYAVTREKAFLDGALKGAAYLRAVASDTPSGGKMVFHSEPGNEQLFYLSWCHGPSGTARLFHKLTEVTGNREHSRFADKLDVATRDMTVPEQSPGFWNNISQCCGNCGVVEYLVAQYDSSGDSRHLDYARQIADKVLQRATAEGDGLKWIQAEHRVRPELLVAQTGLMQGAAGVGLAMLHLDGALNKRQPFVVLPDNPYFR